MSPDRARGASLGFPSYDRDAGSLGGVGEQIELVDQPPGAGQSDPHAATRGIAVLHRALDLLDAGTLVLEDDAQPLAVARVHDLDVHHATAAVHHRVARQLARRRDDLREIEDAEPESLRPVANHAARGHDIGARAELKGLLPGDDRRGAHSRAVAARSRTAMPRSTSSAV